MNTVNTLSTETQSERNVGTTFAFKSQAHNKFKKGCLSESCSDFKVAILFSLSLKRTLLLVFHLFFSRYYSFILHFFVFLTHIFIFHHFFII